MNLLVQDFVTPYQLLGCMPPTAGHMAHDGLLVEFGWQAPTL
jgi:hypothetical protein